MCKKICFYSTEQVYGGFMWAAADTLWFIQPYDVNFMVQMEERSQINLSPMSQPSFSIFYWIAVQMLQSIEQAKEKQSQLLWRMRLEEKTGTGTSPDGYFFAFNTPFIYQLLFTHNTQICRNSLSTHEKLSVTLLY